MTMNYTYHNQLYISQSITHIILRDHRRVYREVRHVNLPDERNTYSWTRLCPGSSVYERMGEMCTSFEGGIFRPKLHCFEVRVGRADGIRCSKRFRRFIVCALLVSG